MLASWFSHNLVIPRLWSNVCYEYMPVTIKFTTHQLWQNEKKNQKKPKQELQPKRRSSEASDNSSIRSAVSSVQQSADQSAWRAWDRSSSHLSPHHLVPGEFSWGSVSLYHCHVFLWHTGLKTSWREATPHTRSLDCRPHRGAARCAVACWHIGLQLPLSVRDSRAKAALQLSEAAAGRAYPPAVPKSSQLQRVWRRATDPPSCRERWPVPQHSESKAGTRGLSRTLTNECDTSGISWSSRRYYQLCRQASPLILSGHYRTEIPNCQFSNKMLTTGRFRWTSVKHWLSNSKLDCLEYLLLFLDFQKDSVIL